MAHRDHSAFDEDRGGPRDAEERDLALLARARPDAQLHLFRHLHVLLVLRSLCRFPKSARVLARLRLRGPVRFGCLPLLCRRRDDAPAPLRLNRAGIFTPQTEDEPPFGPRRRLFVVFHEARPAGVLVLRNRGVGSSSDYLRRARPHHHKRPQTRHPPRRDLRLDDDDARDAALHQSRPHGARELPADLHPELRHASPHLVRQLYHRGSEQGLRLRRVGHLSRDHGAPLQRL
mmetsp:Transcript_7162/g.25587  ORF Transcript_7162/g.25587 Transcript_7162/m.25587 type:complete len:232 (-) Transcript_7162:118-813(-)